MVLRLIFLLISSPHISTSVFRQFFPQKVVSFEKSKNKYKYCLVFAKIRENIWWADELVSKAYIRDLGVEAIVHGPLEQLPQWISILMFCIMNDVECFTLISIYFLFFSFWKRFEKKYQQPISLGAIPALQYGND